ncbi:MAG: sulfatase-like hydrolase/transferase, partial [Cyclobacteriaceae bacterium]|nr:sulfatase-like hydrolase/transferase [Cyclobacteriaceae bacterium]
ETYEQYTLSQYAPVLMLGETLTFLEENREGPFFLYFASPIPHVPLQAPEEYVVRYHQVIGPEEPYSGDQGYFPNRTPRATYAAMVSYLDFQVGEILNKIDELGLGKNTVVFFTSDNGPTYNGGSDSPFFNSARPFHSEKGWAKGFLHEGGIRVPLIVKWPGKIKAGTESGWIGAFHDFFPTLYAIAGQGKPDDSDGISFLPALLDGGQSEVHDYLYWEFPSNGGQQAVRMGKWKGLRENIFEGNLEILLFDLEHDPQEETDVSSSYPLITDSIRTIMDAQHEPAAVERFRMEALGD